MKQLSEIPRALGMSAQLYTSTYSLPVTSLTTQLDTEQMSPWTLPLSNLSLHFTSATMSWPVMLRMQTLKAQVCNEETSLWRAWKSNQLIQPRGELTEAGEAHYMLSLLATNLISSKIGRTEHFFVFHTHFLTHGYQPTLMQSSEGSKTPCTWYTLESSVEAWFGHIHWSQNVQLKGTNTFQDIISTMQEGCAAFMCQEKCHEHHNPQIHSHATPPDQQHLINSECGSVLKHLLLSLRPTESDEEESLCITPSRTCCKHIWQHREVPLWHNPFLCTPNIFRFSTDCQECL